MSAPMIKPRRFENGSVETIAIRSIERAGILVVRARARCGSGPVDKWHVRGKVYDTHEIVRFANRLRIERGEEPLISPKRSGA